MNSKSRVSRSKLKGRNTGGDNFPAGTDAIRTWMFDNPHIMNLGRLRLMRPGGRALVPGDITGLKRTLDLWTGVQTSHYQIAGQEVNVETCVHPSLDLVAVRIESPLVASGELKVALDFAYPSLKNSAWVGDFGRTSGHATVAALPRTSDASILPEGGCGHLSCRACGGAGWLHPRAGTCFGREEARHHTRRIWGPATNGSMSPPRSPPKSRTIASCKW